MWRWSGRNYCSSGRYLWEEWNFVYGKFYFQLQQSHMLTIWGKREKIDKTKRAWKSFLACLERAGAKEWGEGRRVLGGLAVAGGIRIRWKCWDILCKWIKPAPWAKQTRHPAGERRTNSRILHRKGSWRKNKLQVENKKQPTIWCKHELDHLQMCLRKHHTETRRHILVLEKYSN